MVRRAAVVGLALVGLGVAGCGSSHKSPAPTTTAPATTIAAITTVAPTTTVPATVAPTTVPAPTTTSTTTAPSVAAATVVDCQGDAPATRPTSLTLACGDGGVAVSGITWSSWGGATADGQGMLGENNCNPNCAQGTFVTEAASVELSSLTAGGGAGSYGSITVIPSPPNPKKFTAVHQSLPAG